MSGRQMWMPSNKPQENTPSMQETNQPIATNESVNVESSNANANKSHPTQTSSRGNPRRNRGNNRKPRDAQVQNQSQVDQKPQEENANRPPKPKRKPQRKPKNKEQKQNNVNSDSTVNTTTTTTTTTSTEDNNNNNVEIKHSKSGKVPTLIKPKHTKPQPLDSKLSSSTPSSISSTDSHSALAANIIERLESNTYECMICTDTIRRQVTIWSCTNCFSLFHLYCIKKWTKSSEEQGPKAPWRCPGCQYVYVNRPTPKCYCGKTNDPAYNAYLLPHSCGEICGKSRPGEGCPHPWNLICHPGHCPPCSASGPLKHCYCGNISYRLRCGQKDPGRSCGDICHKMLTCNKHQCKDICHAGRCSPCGVSELQICYCGKVKAEKPCGSGQEDKTSGESHHFSCLQICDRLLGCGNHRCEKVCHKGPCEECPLLPKNVTTCPCGKIPLELISPKVRTSCLDDVKTCPNVCGKSLLCGKHTCPNKCHSGPCPRCQETVKAPCRCHGTFVNVPCYQVNGKEKSLDKLICNKMCKAKRICGRHDCGNQCCPSSPMADPGGYDPSGSHICNLICNRKLKCNKHLCDMLCHSGRCPPCHITMHEQYVCECGYSTMEPPIMCGTKLPECPKICVRQRPCGHANTHNCHPRETACPPCTAPTEKMCAGGHEMKKYVPCNVLSLSCGKSCGKMLVCGVHPCKRVCHSDTCQPVTDATSCGQLCGMKRELCDHKCQSMCHGDKPCPKVPCRDLIRISCPCKRRSVEVECLRGGDNDNKDNSGIRELMCDEQCAIEARNRKLAEAFGISDRNTGSIYPDILIQLGKANREFVMRTERRFEDLIRTASYRTVMPPMDRVQRRMVHEMAKFYNLDTESFDKEPNRTVTVTKRKDSKIPTPLLSNAIVEYMKNNQPNAVSVPASGSTTYCGLLVANAIAHGQLLNSFMAPFAGDFQIKWMDDDALIAFTDQTAMKTALFVLAGGPFQVREYKDKIELEEPIKKQIKVKSAKPYTLTAPTPEWCKDSNFFTALYNMDQQQAKEKKAEKEKEEVKKSTWADLEEEEAQKAAVWNDNEEKETTTTTTTTTTTLPTYENWESEAVNEEQL